MRIALFPVGGDETASARIRVHTLHKALTELGHSAVLDDPHDAQVLFIQKGVTAELLASAEAARARGALVIYDADDVGRDLWRFVAPSRLHRLLRIADVLTTDTQGHREIYLRDYAAPSVELLPDAVDYYPAGPARPAMAEAAPLRVLWFGNPANLAVFAPYAAALSRMPGIQVVAITQDVEIPRLSATLPEVAFLPWSRERFVADLQSCALSVLSHDGTEADRAKSNNKMIASITWGVPAIVSRTPEYERTAREAGVEHALFSDLATLVRAIEDLRSVPARTAYLDAAQPVIWERYSPSSVASRFLEIVSTTRELRATRPLPAFLPWLGRASRGDIPTALAYELKRRFGRGARPPRWSRPS